jgi:hypothetical protein
VKGMMNLALQNFFLFILASDILHAIKSYDMGPPALLPLRRKVCCGFLLPLTQKHTLSSLPRPRTVLFQVRLMCACVFLGSSVIWCNLK